MEIQTHREGFFSTLTRSAKTLATLCWLSFASITYSETTENVDSEADSLIHIEMREASKSYDVWVYNTGWSPITLTVELRPNTELTPKQWVDFPTTLPPHAALLVFSIDKADVDISEVVFRPWTNHLPGSMNVDDDVVYKLPCDCSTLCRVSQGKGSESTHIGRNRNAVDFDFPEGTPVLAISDGTVVDLHSDSQTTCSENSPQCNEHLNFIEVATRDGALIEYLHLQYDGVFVELGDKVITGQVIALSGNTGYSSAPHLHVAILRVTSDLTHETVPILFETKTGVRRLETGETAVNPDCLTKSEH